MFGGRAYMEYNHTFPVYSKSFIHYIYAEKNADFKISMLFSINFNQLAT